MNKLIQFIKAIIASVWMFSLMFAGVWLGAFGWIKG